MIINNGRKIAIRVVVGVLAFVCGYIILNYTQILFKVYYRYAAAHDLSNATLNFIGFAIQGLLLLIACVFLHKRLLVVILMVIVLSASPPGASTRGEGQTQHPVQTHMHIHTFSPERLRVRP